MYIITKFIYSNTLIELITSKMTNTSQLSKGSYVTYKGEPCVIRDLEHMSGNKEDTKVKIVLEGLMTGKIVNSSLSLSEMQEADVRRRCATVIAKSKDKLQILDSVSFDTIDADVSKELFEQAGENDQVTYIRFGDNAKVLEIRK